MPRRWARTTNDLFFEVVVFAVPVMTGIVISETRYGGPRAAVIAPYVVVGIVAVVAWILAADRIRRVESNGE